MCGRFFIGDSEEAKAILEIIDRKKISVQEMKRAGEAFPGDTVPVLASDRERQPSAFAMHWGYRLNRKLLFNARSETAMEKEIFREGMRSHRCIIPAAWYFEWDPEKHKHRIRPESGMTYLAGIYRMEDRPVFTILTREPGASTAGIHPRMPVILPASGVRQWIDPQADPLPLLSMALTEMKID